MLSSLAQLEQRHTKTRRGRCNYGERITCCGVSDIGKAIVMRFGKEWEHTRDAATVEFSDQAGPWWLVHPVHSPSAARWINRRNDEHIKVMTMGSVLDDWRRCKDEIPTIQPLRRERFVKQDEEELKANEFHSGCTPRPKDPLDYKTLFIGAAPRPDLYNITRSGDRQRAHLGWILRIGHNRTGQRTKNYYYRKFNDRDYGNCCWASLKEAVFAREEVFRKVREARQGNMWISK